MNTETINTQLYEKMFAEQERYRGWPLSQPPGFFSEACPQVWT